MSHQQTTDNLLWNNLLSTQNETISHKDTSITGPSNTTKSKTATVIPGIGQLPATAKTTFLGEQVSQWDWTTSTDSPLQQLKQWICNTILKTTLGYYDRTQPLIMQRWQWIWTRHCIATKQQTIAFASKTLTDVETRYANIEWECHSVVFRLEKFHTYMYGRHITVYNDHKPLEMITKKPIHAAPQILQRMLLQP